MINHKWLTLDELAEYLKLSRTKLYRMAQKGEIPASKIGAQWRFDREEIDEWMKSQRPGGTASQRREIDNNQKGR
jgi:excisionase family DNA binding protein